MVDYSKAIIIIPATDSKPEGKYVDLRVVREICEEKKIDLNAAIKEIFKK